MVASDPVDYLKLGEFKQGSESHTWECFPYLSSLFMHIVQIDGIDFPCFVNSFCLVFELICCHQYCLESQQETVGLSIANVSEPLLAKLSRQRVSWLLNKTFNCAIFLQYFLERIGVLLFPMHTVNTFFLCTV